MAYTKVNKSWFKNGQRVRLGIRHSEATRKVIGEKSKLSYLNGRVPWNKGKRGVQVWSEKSKKKLSDSLKGRQLSPIKLGLESPNYKDGHTITRKQILHRDNYTCQVCGFREPEIMEVDHIKPKSKFPELKYELNNLITLCPNCHRRKTNRDLKEIYQ